MQICRAVTSIAPKPLISWNHCGVNGAGTVADLPSGIDWPINDPALTWGGKTVLRHTASCWPKTGSVAAETVPSNFSETVTLTARRSPLASS